MEKKTRHSRNGQTINAEINSPIIKEVIAEATWQYINGPRETRFERAIAVFEKYKIAPRDRPCIVRMVKPSLLATGE